MPFPRSLALLFLSLALLVPSSASAEVIAGLDIDIGELAQTPLGSDLLATIDDAFEQSDYRWLSPDQGYHQLPASLADCRDEECLLDIGDELDAVAAVDIQLSVQSQIYEWTLQLWDLETGQPITTQESTCEFCGDSEVESQFRESIASALLNVDTRDHHYHDPADTTVDDDLPAHSQIRISVIPEDTKIFVDDDPIGQGDATLDLDTGEYELRFSHPDHHGLRETLIITDDSSPVFVFRVHLAEAVGEERHVITRGDGWVDHIESRRPTIGWSAVGAGGALTLTSALLARRHGQPTCPDDVAVQRCPDVHNTASLATFTGIVGVASLTAGIGLLLWPRLAGQDQEPEPVSRGIDVAPSVSSGFSGVSLTGRF